MPEILTFLVKKKDYRSRAVHRGKSITKVMEEVLAEQLSALVSSIKSRYITSGRKTGSDYVAKRSGKLRESVKLSISRTEKGSVTGSIVVGSDRTPYAPIHVGTESPENYTGRFVIPLPWARKVDGTWRTPFVPGNLRSLHPHLFRGRNPLREDLLYYNENGKLKAVFKLQNKIHIKQRVKLDEIMEMRKSTILRAMEDAFGQYDYAYLSSQIRGGADSFWSIGGSGE